MVQRPVGQQRQYVWTEQGLAQAEANKVELSEVADALYAPTGLRVERMLGDMLLRAREEITSVVYGVSRGRIV